MQADFCKGLSHPKRIQILNILKRGDRTVNELVEMTGIPQANLSQHLGILRHLGILQSHRDGLNIYYGIADKRIVEACDLVREAIAERLMRSQVALSATT
jgi:DNA-binding transcriptional ArsR family regulator